MQIDFFDFPACKLGLVLTAESPADIEKISKLRAQLNPTKADLGRKANKPDVSIVLPLDALLKD